MEATAKTVENMVPRRDPRLNNIIVYMKSNGSSANSVLERMLVEQFSQCQVTDMNVRSVY